MSVCQSSGWLWGWEGYEVVGVERRVAVERPEEVWIELQRVAAQGGQCSRCGAEGCPVHDRSWRVVRDLSIFEARTYLRVPRYRVRCATCGPRVERLSWLERHCRVTRRLAETVGRFCALLPLQHVAEVFGLGWDLVKSLDLAFLQSRVGPVDVSGVEAILMDEFAIQKGHRYATVIVEAATRRVLWVGRGRSREDIRPFFELLGPEGCRRLQAVGMDMNGAFEVEVRHHCPQAQIVFDLFHVVAKYSREVLDRVRIEEAQRLQHDKPARKVVKTSRWLLLRNPDHLKRPSDRVRLRELLDANQRLLSVYLLKEDLKLLWRHQRPELAQRAWEDWFHRAIHSRIPPLQRFAKKLQPYLHGILAHATWPLNTSVLEGINNKIKVIKRMAYGFHDDQYFFLKIRAAFPGNVR